MNSSAISSVPLSSATAPVSDRERFSLLLLQQLESLSRSLPASFEQSFAHNLEKWRAISSSESDERAANAGTMLTLLALMKALDEKLDLSIRLSKEVLEERKSREETDAKLDRLNSLLAAYNDYKPQ
jgi:hypothetical protein